MTRPVRLKFGGALYHVAARGDRREAIYEDEVDRKHFLDVLGQVVGQFNWCCHAYCLMSNHYHLVIATPDGNLSREPQTWLIDVLTRPPTTLDRDLDRTNSLSGCRLPSKNQVFGAKF